MNLLDYKTKNPINTFIVPFVFPDYIEGCVESIWKFCSPEDHRLIVVDNACEVDLYPKLKDKVHLYIRSYRNLGCSKAWNMGPQLSRTKYVSIMGDDTRIIHERWWPEVMGRIEQDKLGVWFCHPCYLTQPSKVSGQLEPPEFNDTEWKKIKAKSGDMPGRFNCLIIRQDIIENLECGDDFLFNEDLYPCEQVDGWFKNQMGRAKLPMTAIHFPVWHMRAMTYQSGKMPIHDRGKTHPSYAKCPRSRRYL